MRRLASAVPVRCRARCATEVHVTCKLHNSRMHDGCWSMPVRTYCGALIRPGSRRGVAGGRAGDTSEQCCWSEGIESL